MASRGAKSSEDYKQSILKKREKVIEKLSKNDPATKGVKLSFAFRDETIACLKALRTNTNCTAVAIHGEGVDDKSG